MPSGILRDRDQVTIDEASVRRIVEAQGGVSGMVAKMEEFHNVVALMRQERPRLMEEYPDKWVVMGKDGDVVVGDSIDDALEKADALGMERGEMIVDYLETDPPMLIL